MKNICPKSKGKIHPSPAPPSASGGGGGGGDALSVLKLLPAAIFALTAALALEDKEVVAYMMIRSINGTGPAADAAEERRRCRRTGGVQRPLFDCGCFDCYTCFWSRWDCSKDRETIHTVVEAFEEHLASKERGKGKGKEAKRKKKKKGKDEKREKEAAAVKEREADEDVAEISAAEENKGFEEGEVIVSEGCFAEEKEEAADGEVDEEEGEVVELPAVSGGERRRAWADVMGIFNSRLWSLWSPGV